MSLVEPGFGILGTNVTWQDVESEMQNAFRTTAKFGKKKSVTDVGKMKELFSKVGLIEADWVDLDTNARGRLPSKFVIKVPTLLPFAEHSKMLNYPPFNKAKIRKESRNLRNFHNREVAVYKLLEKEVNRNIPTTKIFAMKPFFNAKSINAFIISEYIPDIIDVEAENSEAIPVEELIPVVRSAAAFSALGEKISKEKLTFASGTENLEIALENLCDEAHSEKLSSLIRSLFPTKLVQEFLKICELYRNSKMIDKYVTISEFLGHKPVLTHGDLWSNNLLFTKEDGKFVLQAIVDWQNASFSGPGLDLASLATSCLSGEDRRGKIKILLKNYYESFVEELDGRPVPYTFEQLTNSFRLYFPLMAILMVQRMLFNLSNSRTDGNEVPTSKIDRIVALLEDVIKIHSENLQQFPDFFNLDLPTNQPVTPKDLTPQRIELVPRGQIHEVAGHQFKATTLLQPSFCSYCKQFIYGIGKQGYRCQGCETLVHKKCHHKVVLKCVSLTPPVSPNACTNSEGVHQFCEHFFKRPTWCDHCGDMLYGITKQGLRCVNCRSNIHHRCKQDVLTSCNRSIN